MLLTITCECLLAVPPPSRLPPLGSLLGFPPTDTPSSSTPQAQPFQNRKGLISPPGMQRGPQTQVLTWPRRPTPRAEELAPLSTLTCASHIEGAKKSTRAGSPGGPLGGTWSQEGGAAGIGGWGARWAGPPALPVCGMWGRGVNACTAVNLYNLKAQSPWGGGSAQTPARPLPRRWPLALTPRPIPKG